MTTSAITTLPNFQMLSSRKPCSASVSAIGTRRNACLPESSLKSSSHGGSDHHWSSSAVPQPLPLPESPLTRRTESTIPVSGHAHLGFSSPFENPGFASRNTIDHDHDAMTDTKPSSSNLGRFSFDSTVAHVNLRVHIPATRFLIENRSCKYPIAVSHDDDFESISNLSMHVFASSAPTSVFTSPFTSPNRSNNVDFLDPIPTINFHQEVYDKLKLLKAKSQEEGSQHNNILSRVWPPENNHVDAHPLPLPPRASSPAAAGSPLQHQSSTMMHHGAENLSTKKGQWQKGKLIGRGSFGSVYHATNLETGASCAMKEVDLIPDDPKSAECIKQLEQEIRILRQLHHPNIVQYYGSEIVGDHLYIYMEYVHPGSISQFLREHCGAMTESVVRNFTRHILSGLAYLHSTKTIHRDIKGANLLVNQSGIVKLADFGMAKILTGNSYELSLKGSPYWMAPEVMKADIKNESNPELAMASDIWSLGCTIIEMLTGKPPWSEFEGPSAMFKILLHNSPPIPETLSSVGKDFLQQCFRRDPADRPSAAKLLKHAFVQNFCDQDVQVHPQLYPRVGPGSGDNSSSRKGTSRNRSDVISTSMG